MKEATGELNMTVITIVAIAALVAFFYVVIWPTIQAGMALQSACSSVGDKGGTVNLDNNAGKINCQKSGNNMVCSVTYNNGKAGQSRTC